MFDRERSHGRAGGEAEQANCRTARKFFNFQLNIMHFNANFGAKNRIWQLESGGGWWSQLSLIFSRFIPHFLPYLSFGLVTRCLDIDKTVVYRFFKVILKFNEKNVSYPIAFLFFRNLSHIPYF